jgi:hypothetical protein
VAARLQHRTTAQRARQSDADRLQSAASHRLVAEELAAILQIIQVDLADVDLLIVPSNVSMELTLGKKRHFDLRQLPDNGQLRWVIEVPPKWPQDTSGGGVNLVLALAAMMLREITGLDDKTFKAEFEKRIRRGLFNRALWIRPPSDFFGQSVELCKIPFDLSKLEPPSASRQPVPREASELAWRSEKAPTYSAENARRNLRSRYRRLTPFLRSVAPKLMADSRTNGLLKKLHESGMLDWQIMSLILNIALQARVNRFTESAPRSPGKLKTFYLKQLKQLGKADAADFDANSLTEETIDLQAKMLTMAASNTWRIVNHRQTPDFAAVKRLLDERFGHSTDDIAHEDVFGWSSVDKTSNL